VCKLLTDAFTKEDAIFVLQSFKFSTTPRASSVCTGKFLFFHLKNPTFLLYPLLISFFLSVSCATAPRAEEEEEEEEEKYPMSSRFSSYSHLSGQQKSKK
jgi:hypothetical protein